MKSSTLWSVPSASLYSARRNKKRVIMSINRDFFEDLFNKDTNISWSKHLNEILLKNDRIFYLGNLLILIIFNCSVFNFSLKSNRSYFLFLTLHRTLPVQPNI